MNPSPKTIQIFLPGGDPTGIRVAEITTRIVQVIDVPRKLLPDFIKMPESAQVGVYYLVAAPEDGSEPQVYIGQTGDMCTRLKEHDAQKEFWERALVLISPFGFSPTGEAFNLSMEDVATSVAVATPSMTAPRISMGSARAGKGVTLRAISTERGKATSVATPVPTTAMATVSSPRRAKASRSSRKGGQARAPQAIRRGRSACCRAS
jgi:hypothetical protein